MLEKLIAKRGEALAAMKEFNDAHPEMSDAQLAEFKSLEAKFDKANRDVKLEQTKNVLANEIDEVIVADSTDTLSVAAAEYTKAFDTYLSARNIADATAAMTEGVDTDGGYTVPESYQNTVVQKLNALSITRGLSTVLTTTSTLNIPTEGEAPTFTWIDEGADYGETKSTFGQKKLNAYKLGGIIKVSKELIQDTSINFDSYMAGQIARGIDKAESPAFATGDGSNKPTGYLTSSAVGANSTTAATDAVTADELIDIFFDLKAEYREKAVWRCTDSTLKAISKLKDSDGNYLVGTLADGISMTIKGRPVKIDNSMPELGAGNKFIVFGDFTYFQIADRGGMTIQRLDELFAGKGLVGFQVTKRVDAKVIIEEAFNAGKNAAE